MDLKVVANKTGAPQKVLIDNPEYWDFKPVAWTPDGKSILVLAAMTVDETWMLAWVSASDGSVKPLKSLGWRFELGMSLPALSPDGRYIGYAASVSDRPPGARGQADRAGNSPNSGDVHIYVLAADGSSEEIPLVKGASINQHPTWMPDGKSLLFVSDRAGSFGLWSVSLQDNSLKQVKADFGGKLTGPLFRLRATTSFCEVFPARASLLFRNQEPTAVSKSYLAPRRHGHPTASPSPSYEQRTTDPFINLAAGRHQSLWQLCSSIPSRRGTRNAMSPTRNSVVYVVARLVR